MGRRRLALTVRIKHDRNKILEPLQPRSSRVSLTMSAREVLALGIQIPNKCVGLCKLVQSRRITEVRRLDQVRLRPRAVYPRPGCPRSEQARNGGRGRAGDERRDAVVRRAERDEITDRWGVAVLGVVAQEEAALGESHCVKLP